MWGDLGSQRTNRGCLLFRMAHIPVVFRLSLRSVTRDKHPPYACEGCVHYQTWLCQYTRMHSCNVSNDRSSVFHRGNTRFRGITSLWG